MQIESLKVFCDLIESRSFSQAAIRNFITQSAVSQQVKALETRYDMPLLNRDGRSVQPTEAGKIFYDAAKEILNRFFRMQSQLKSAGQEMVGSLRVASVYSVGLYEMTLPIRTFLRTYPRVNLAVEYCPANRVYENILTGAADLGIVTYPKPRKGIQVLSLPADRLVLICTPEHAFARHRRIEIKKLNGESFIAFEKDTPSRQALDQILEEHGVQARIVMEFENIETIKRAVEIGAGVAIVPLLSVQREVESGALVEVNFKGNDFFRPLGAVVKQRNALSPPAQKFIELLQGPPS
jgi:LysR family transcriptional regulator, transcriptional activator of the cysJI operon